ncbi:MAG: hypothetical protein ACRD1T_21535, partial [Acidimicrobiia bacterium]
LSAVVRIFQVREWVTFRSISGHGGSEWERTVCCAFECPVFEVILSTPPRLPWSVASPRHAVQVQKQSCRLPDAKWETYV